MRVSQFVPALVLLCAACSSDDTAGTQGTHVLADVEGSYLLRLPGSAWDSTRIDLIDAGAGAYTARVAVAFLPPATFSASYDGASVRLGGSLTLDRAELYGISHDTLKEVVVSARPDGMLGSEATLRGHFSDHSTDLFTDRDWTALAKLERDAAPPTFRQQLESPLLPWSPFVLGVSEPVDSPALVVATSLLVDGTDQPAGATIQAISNGVEARLLSFDSARLRFDVAPGVRDPAGNAAAPFRGPGFSPLDVGAPLILHDFENGLSVGYWGPVAQLSSTDARCAASGCLAVEFKNADCYGRQQGVAGRLQHAGGLRFRYRVVAQAASPPSGSEYVQVAVTRPEGTSATQEIQIGGADFDAYTELGTDWLATTWREVSVPLSSERGEVGFSISPSTRWVCGPSRPVEVTFVLLLDDIQSTP